MKFLKTLSIMALALGLVACGNKKTDADEKGAPMIEKSDIKVDGLLGV